MSPDLQQALAQHQAGRLREAERLYRQIIEREPLHAEAWRLLGVVALQSGQLDAAAASCRHSLELDDQQPLAWSNLGQALMRLGRPGEAIACQAQALRLDDGPGFRAAFVQTVRTLHFGSPHAPVRELLMRALDEGWADAAELLTPATSLVTCELPTLPALAGDRLLHRLLQTECINSIELERTLTRLRRDLLAAALVRSDTGTLGLHAAIARQCFINEYVWSCSDDEAALLALLRQRLADSARPEPAWLAASASYAPLGELPRAEAWAALGWPADVQALFTQQLHEPALERRMRAGIPALTPITHAVSQQVREQYEANPYPRWVQAPAVPMAVELDVLLRHRFPGAPLQPVARQAALDVLVAGCGTGQHPIRVARQLKGARVLAVDLSLSSLAYAKRKTEEIGLAGAIEYAQADILELGAIERRFDLIESTGVLHHMDDPIAGWQALLRLLRPGGLMAIGLYSEVGRRDVVAARQHVAADGLPRSVDEIRAGRQRLMNDGQRFESFMSSRDFCSTSACRDLLFHVQEHRFTLPQLKAALAELGLRFIGFEVEPDVAMVYAQRFPDDPARIDLDRWHAFETERPETFARMYQFWVQKPAG